MSHANKRINWLIGAVLTLVTIVLAGVFMQSYQTLGDTIEKERSTYVSEIKNQLVKHIQAEKEQQVALVSIYGQVLTHTQPQSFEEVYNLLSSMEYNSTGDEVFLLDTQGIIYNLNKEERTLSEQSLLYALLVERTSVFGYSQINMRDEYWIYGAPIDPVTIDGVEVCAVINARSTANFGERMSTGILNNSGFSYVTSKTGRILLYPAAHNDMGYDLFLTLEASGVNQDILDRMAQDFSQGVDGSQIVEFRDDKWLLAYTGDLFDDWVVVVTMPMTITGADTYKVLHSTMTSVLLMFGSIICLIAFVIRFFSTRERERERTLQQEMTELAIAKKITESKNAFLANMSHDIRTPLNAIIGLIQITSGMVADRPDAAENLSQAGRSAEYLLGMLNDLLDMSKIESGKMELRKAPFHLPDLIDSIWVINQATAEKKALDVTVQIGGELSPWYMGDRGRISQIMVNLLSNAIKFTPSGGQILFSVTAEPATPAETPEAAEAANPPDAAAASAAPATAPAAPPMDRLVFRVQDTGVGMSEEYLSRLFEPFEQESATQDMNKYGSGLGLSIVKNLTELMGGKIDVTSQKGVGSCFTVTLCLPRVSPPKEAAAEHTDGLTGRRILLVEDNRINTMIAKQLLERNGLVVETVENGQQALDSFGQSAAGYFDAILMDVRMPVMDGLTATREIRSLTHPQAQTIPIIAMSANAFDEDINKALACGMNAYLPKPIDVKKTLDTLVEQLKGR